MDRTQFTFYESFYKSLSRIRKPADRALAYDTVARIALYGEEPDLDSLPESVAIALELVRPVLDSSRRKSEAGKKGGESKRKQTGSKSKQSGSKRKQTEAKTKQEQVQEQVQEEEQVQEQVQEEEQVQEQVQEEEQVQVQDKEQMLYTPPTPPKGDAFDRFWAAYPRKVGKGDARKAFDRAVKKTDVSTLISAVEAQKGSRQWREDGGKYIPNPATWLNQERWEDDVDQVQERLTTNPFLQLLWEENDGPERNDEDPFDLAGSLPQCLPGSGKKGP